MYYSIVHVYCMPQVVIITHTHTHTHTHTYIWFPKTSPIKPAIHLDSVVARLITQTFTLQKIVLHCRYYM